MANKPEYMDFVGFTYNGQHSSTFDIIRTSKGKGGYQGDLIPDLSDEATDRPGGDGAYYHGSNFKKTDFEVAIAYDNLTEEGKRKLFNWLYPDRKLHELIFDETPYKKYYVKVSSKVQLEDICFYENYQWADGEKYGGQRVYKGTGKIKFTAYMPFALEVDKRAEYYEDFEEDDRYLNVDEWIASSGILSASETQTKANGTQVGAPFKLYNPGDIESDYQLLFSKKGLYWNYTADTPDDIVVSGVDLYTPYADNTKLEDIREYIEQKGDNLYVFYHGSPQKVLLSDTNKVEIVENADNAEKPIVLDTGYFEDDVTPIVSDNYGAVYTLYVKETTNEIPAEHAKWYTLNEDGVSLTGAPDCAKDFNIYVNFGSQVIACQVLAVTEDNMILLYNPEIKLNEKGVDAYNNVQIYPSNNIGLRFDLSGNKYEIQFPPTALTSPKNYSEAQKAAIVPTIIKIDTNKQTIEYNTNPETTVPTPENYFNVPSDWSGISGVLYGALGKIPKGEGELTIDEMDNSKGVFLSNSPVLYYHYFYI